MDYQGEYKPLGFEKRVPKGYEVLETKFQKGIPTYTVLRDKVDKYYLYKVEKSSDGFTLKRIKTSEKSNFKEMENTYE